MITVLAAEVTLPTWLFLLMFGAGIALNAVLMWCNSTQREDNRRLRRRLLLQDPTKVAQHLIDQIRGRGEQ